ncbi:hypothetical protein AMATHDRAFT_9670 [Amanita thiersii Skay4041]|uniref:Uncharacterized protein n=1 Tax=Amanita thiersii Skay4041 TaxID=703135 RepID=A0A2A9N6H0_9AGAR|nr:hypothetical protein AMATHDRAFT_9670 [Amanita thiersii Skay4041]
MAIGQTGGATTTKDLSQTSIQLAVATASSVLCPFPGDWPHSCLYATESLENQGEPANILNSWKFPGQLPGMQPVFIPESWKHAGGKFKDNQSDNSDQVVPIFQVTGPGSWTYAAAVAQGVPTNSKQVFRNSHKDCMAEEAKRWDIIEASWDAWNNALSNFLKKEVEGRNATFMAVYKIAKQPRLDWGNGPDNDHKIGYINSWLEDQKKFNQLLPKQKKQDDKLTMEVQNDNSLPSIPAPKSKGKQKALTPSPSSTSSSYISSGELEKTLNELFDKMAIVRSTTEKSNWKGKLANAGPSNRCHQGLHHKGKTLGTTKMSLGE